MQYIINTNLWEILFDYFPIEYIFKLCEYNKKLKITFSNKFNIDYEKIHFFISKEFIYSFKRLVNFNILDSYLISNKISELNKNEKKFIIKYLLEFKTKNYFIFNKANLDWYKEYFIKLLCTENLNINEFIFSCFNENYEEFFSKISNSKTCIKKLDLISCDYSFLDYLIKNNIINLNNLVEIQFEICNFENLKNFGENLVFKNLSTLTLNCISFYNINNLKVLLTLNKIKNIELDRVKFLTSNINDLYKYIIEQYYYNKELINIKINSIIDKNFFENKKNNYLENFIFNLFIYNNLKPIKVLNKKLLINLNDTLIYDFNFINNEIISLKLKNNYLINLYCNEIEIEIYGKKTNFSNLLLFLQNYQFKKNIINFKINIIYFYIYLFPNKLNENLIFSNVKNLYINFDKNNNNNISFYKMYIWFNEIINLNIKKNILGELLEIFPNCENIYINGIYEDNFFDFISLSNYKTFNRKKLMNIFYNEPLKTWKLNEYINDFELKTNIKLNTI